MVQLVPTVVVGEWQEGSFGQGWEQEEWEMGEWDEMEADGCGYGEEGTLMGKGEAETPPKGSLHKILILLSLENP